MLYNGSINLSASTGLANGNVLFQVLHKGTAFPTSPAPVQGQMFYRTDTDKMYIHDGSVWQTAATSGYSGYSGISGYSGVSGYSGISGYSGESGYSGYSGISGYSGDSGYSGVSGYSGDSGYSGFSGFSGYSGPGAGYDDDYECLIIGADTL